MESNVDQIAAKMANSESKYSLFQPISSKFDDLFIPVCCYQEVKNELHHRIRLAMQII